MDPITAIISLVSNVVGKIWPDKTAEDQAKLALALQEQLAQSDLLKAQVDVDKTEASNPSVFVSGWRPFIGWICGLAFAWQFLALPICSCIASSLGHPLVVPAFDMATMSTVLMGMLGLGGLRTYEKVQGVARQK